MEKLFIYPKWILWIVYGLLGLFPIIGLILLIAIDFPQTNEEMIVFSFFTLLILAIFISIILWLWNLSRTRFYISDKGIIFKSLFKNMKIEWTDISEITKKYYYGGKFGGSPKDLEITTNAGKTVKVFHFLVADETKDMEEGINNFEAEISKYRRTT